jgi:hypothetical protein
MAGAPIRGLRPEGLPRKFFYLQERVINIVRKIWDLKIRQFFVFILWTFGRIGKVER